LILLILYWLRRRSARRLRSPVPTTGRESYYGLLSVPPSDSWPLQRRPPFSATNTGLISSSPSGAIPPPPLPHSAANLEPRLDSENLVSLHSSPHSTQPTQYTPAHMHTSQVAAVTGPQVAGLQQELKRLPVIMSEEMPPPQYYD
jgi:hypothetical protein